MAENKFCGYGMVLDLETTGLHAHKDRMVQLGVCWFEIWKTEAGILDMTEKATLLENCRSDDVRMAEKSIEITGITQESVDQQLLTASDVLRRLETFIEDNRHQSDAPLIMVAHNAFFDFVVLAHEALRLNDAGGALYFRKWRCSNIVDSVVVAKTQLDQTCLLRKANGRCSFKLGDLYSALTKQNLVGAHGALADARAVLTIFQHAADRVTACLERALRGEHASDLGLYSPMDFVERAITFNKQASTTRQTVLGVLSRLPKRKSIEPPEPTESAEQVAAEPTEPAGSKKVKT